MLELADINGVEPFVQRRLSNCGVFSSHELLQAGSTSAGRNWLYQKTGVDQGMILRWIQQLDMSRLEGMTREYLALLNRAGLYAVEDFRHREAGAVHQRLCSLNEYFRQIQSLPSKTMILHWIQRSEDLGPLIDIDSSIDGLPIGSPNDREHPRLQCELDARMVMLSRNLNERGGKSLRGKTRDIALGGASIITPKVLPVGTRLNLILEVTALEDNFHLPGEVLWCHIASEDADEWLIGLKFCDGSGSDILRWREYLSHL